MTNAHEESRTLVKSPPELWAELSDVTSLSRHLSEFGEIRITRLEPETAVAWEGERASGTVRLEPSGWGTKVILTAQASVVAPDSPVSEAPPQREPSPEPAPPPQPAPPPSPAPMPPAPTRAPRPSRSGLFGRLFGFRSPPRPEEPPAPGPAPQPPEPKPEPGPQPAPEPTVPPSEQLGFDAAAILASALDSLGQAHHRPFSRA
jgi:hypothetical protein